jgi:uncharacterized protein YprB with RNaseH-like and TPR domain
MELEDKLKNLARLGSTRRRGVSVREKDEITEVLGGRVIRNKFGEFVLATARFDLAKLHRDLRFPPSWKPRGELLTKICTPKKSAGEQACPGPFNLAETVFFDCETTGLAGGAGTYAFLVGLGYLAGSEFCVEQYFMEDFHQERAVLAAIAEKMDGFRSLVSYNGKCFDLPLLETRWTVNRIDFDSSRWFHLDLLYPSRRIWKRRIGDCSLGSIERQVLGVARQIDVPSFMVPQIYFDYLRTGQAEALIPVFHHNSHDIVSLLKLAVVIDGTLEAFGPVAPDDPTDLYSLGRIHQRLGDHHAGVRCFERALTSGASLELRRAIMVSLAFAHKKSGSLEEAAGIWQNLTGEEPPFSLLAHEELAKHWEHRIKDYGKALSLVERAMARLTSDRSPESASKRERMLNSLEHRKSRLRRKIKRVSACRQS